MADWTDFKRDEQERESAVTGKHRVVITDVTEGQTGANSKNPGTPMIIIKVRPSGRHFAVTHRVVKNEYFNRNMTQFFDAFPEIKFGDFNFLTWIGCEGAAMFKQDDRGYTQVSYFLSPERAADLPPFEGDKPQKQTVTSLEDETEDDGDLPF
jgi:hypothetical protein